MAIEIEKNAATTVIDENKGRDDVRQNPKRRGTSKDVVASLDQRVVGVETSMVELKNQVEGLEGLDSNFTRKREARVVDDFLWEMEQYLEGVNVNAKNEAKSQLHKLKQSGMIQEAKTNLERRGVQDLSTDIAHAEALIYFSMRRESSKPKDQKDKNLKTSYKSGGCFICDGPHRSRDCPKKTSLKGLSAHGDEEASDGGSMGSIRILNAIKAKTEVPNVVGKYLQYVEATINGVKVRAFPMSFANSLCFLDGGKTCMVSTERDAKSGAKTLSVKQLKKGFNKSEPCCLAVTRLETDEGLSKVEVPKAIEWVLEEFKDVMPKEFPKKLPPRREVDHTIELETGSKL
ncbi:hypothetical protein Tco_0282874 [Tanacetum coccineum]